MAIEPGTRRETVGIWDLWWIGTGLLFAFALLVFLLRQRWPVRAAEVAESAETRLLRRLTAGEIDADEYLRQLDALRE